jgi:septation ring formation regulator EzrA
MPTEQLLLTVVTAVIALLSLIVAFATWLSKTKQDSGKQDSHNAVVVTKLDGIDSNVKEIKEDMRTFRKDLEEVRDIAIHASERAEAAHHRLDRAGIDNHK